MNVQPSIKMWIKIKNSCCKEVKTPVMESEITFFIIEWRFEVENLEKIIKMEIVSEFYFRSL